MHATQKPADGKSDANSRIGLGLDELSHRNFERTCRFASGRRCHFGNLRCLALRLLDRTVKALRLSFARHDEIPFSSIDCSIETTVHVRRVAVYPIRTPIPSAIAVVVC